MSSLIIVIVLVVMLLGGPSSSTTSDYPDNIGIMFKFGPLPLIVTTREDGNYARASIYVYIYIFLVYHISGWGANPNHIPLLPTKL